MKGFSSKRIVLKIDVLQDSKIYRLQDSKIYRLQDSKIYRLQDSKIYRLQARPCIFQPPKFHRLGLNKGKIQTHRNTSRHSFFFFFLFFFSFFFLTRVLLTALDCQQRGPNFCVCRTQSLDESNRNHYSVYSTVREGSSRRPAAYVASKMLRVLTCHQTPE